MLDAIIWRNATTSGVFGSPAFSEPRDVELKGLAGTHSIYAVELTP